MPRKAAQLSEPVEPARPRLLLTELGVGYRLSDGEGEP